jgi:hypothetical protein
MIAPVLRLVYFAEIVIHALLIQLMPHSPSAIQPQTVPPEMRIALKTFV